MHRWSIRSLSLFAVVGSVAGIGYFTASPARSQLGVAKGYVEVQSTSPGTAQSGHANVSGTMRAGQFVGGGGGLSGLNASNLTSGTVPIARIPNPFILSGSDPNGVMRLTGSAIGYGGATFTSVSSVPPGQTGVAGVFASNSATGPALYLESTDSTGAGGGLLANIQSPNGTAVSGTHFATSGFGRGGAFSSASVSGIGVEGLATASTGSTFGVRGQASSPNGTGVFGVSLSSTGSTRGGWFQVNSPNGFAVYGQAISNSGPSYGIYGNSLSAAGAGVRGDNESGGFGGIFVSNNVGVEVSSSGTSGRGVVTKAFGADATALRAEALGSGISYGGFFLSLSSSGSALLAQNQAATGLAKAGEFITFSPNGQALVARSQSSGVGPGTAIFATTATTGGTAIEASATASGNSRAFLGTSTAVGAAAVQVIHNATSGLSDGISSFTNAPAAAGVWSRNLATTGSGNALLGSVASPNGIAVLAEALGTGGVAYGVFGSAQATGWGLWANGRSGASGTKSFRIDHPLDPENKYLLHYSSEGPEPLNIYSGTTVTGKDGFAWITLPDYFGSINRDPRVQLTVNDSSEDFVMAKVVGEIEGSGFRIRTSKPGVKVYWEVKAVRNDAYVQRYGAPIEVQKLAHERGRYLHPELYGAPAERGMFHTERERTQNARPGKR